MRFPPSQARVCNAIKVTDMQKNLTNIENFSRLIHSPVYWIDQFGVILGINKAAIQSFGYDSLDEIIGKKVCEIFSDEMAKPSPQIYEQILKTGKVYKHKEFITNIKTGQMHCFKSVKSPLRDENNNLVGFISVSVELTSEESYTRTRKSGVLKYLEILAETLPISLYWEDVNSVVLGGNESVLKAIGAKSIKEVIGKTLYEFHSYEVADKIVQHNNEVMRTEKVLSQEEMITDITTGEVKYFIALKAPLRDDDGNIIGIVGTSIETTAEKEAEILKLESQHQQVALQEQEKFRKLADQVAHDIRSPLASLLMIVKACQTLPERERVALREAATTIGDIANNLLNSYRKKEVYQDQLLGIEERESVLVSPLLLQILTDKKYQYQNLAIKFTHHFSQAGNFSWIKIEPTALKRMLSNIINNSVDSFDQKEGKITLFLDADDEEVRITIEDTGKGMKPELVQKILNYTAVSEGKEDGHGIGLTQAHETLQNNQGHWVIESEIDQGTKFILTFPRAPSLNWIAETLQLNDDDTVVILDDDSSIHMAWDIRFDVILKKFPHLMIKHFELGQETIDFINSLPPDKKQKIFLLADYELLKQDLDGLDVIKKTNISRSILVTSHYAHKGVQQAATETDTKILPKQLASDIAIKISKTTANETIPVLNNEIKEVDVVFVDDDQRLLDSFTFFAFNKEVDTYQNPQHFLDNVSQYPKHTKIMLDHHFSNFDQKGMQIAERLHSLGFTQLYLLSGESFSGLKVPDYLTTILKTDLDKVEAILNG